MSRFSQLFRLSKHSIIYGVGAGISSVVHFFLIPVYTRFLTPADYGILEIFSSTAFVLSIFAYLGIGVALLRFYFDYDEEGKRELISTALIFLTGTSLIYCSALLALGNQFSLIVFDNNQYTPYFIVIFSTIFFDSMVFVALTVFRARAKPSKYVAAILTRFAVSTGLKLYFLTALQWGVLGLLLADLITLVLLYIVLVGNLFKEVRLKFSLAKVKGMLLFGLPLVPSSLAVWILTLADRYFLQFLSTPSELGLYSLGYKFGMVVQTLLIMPFGLAWTPFMLDVAKEKYAKQIHSSVLTYFVFIGMFIALGLSILSKEVIAIMATPPFHDAYKVVPLIALSYVLHGCFMVFQVGIYLEKKTKYVALIVGTGATLNLVLNYLLIPDYGMMGAALATAISYLIMPILMYFASRRFYPIRYEFGRVTKIFLVAVPIYVASIYVTADSVLISVIIKALILLTYPLLLYLLRFYEPEELRKVSELTKVIANRIREKVFGG